MKMKTKLLSLAFAMIASMTINSQTANTYTVSFEKAMSDPCSGNLVRLNVTKEHSFLKNIPGIACDISAINSFKMNRTIAKDSVQNQMYLFVGVNEGKKEKYVAVDANNNHDFSDDQLYTFALPGKTLTREEKLTECVGLQITSGSQTGNIGVDPFNFYGFKYGSTQDERLEVVITFRDYIKAHVQIGDMPVDIQTSDGLHLFPGNISNKNGFEFFYTDKNNKPINKYITKKDTIRIEDELFVISKIEHPNIVLEEVGTLADSSYVGAVCPVVYAKDLDMKNNVNINSLIKNKYVFIDFWGSWCGPCIASIPELKEFYEKIKDRDDAMLLGIASEEKRDIEKLKGIIRDKEIGWDNMIVSKEDKTLTSAIIDKLEILAYPTYLIIDNKGKIVYKERSIYKTQEAIDFFMKLINSK